MTAITGKIGVNRRPGELGVHSMTEFNIVVPDLQKAQNFYDAFGLDVREEGNTLGLYTHGSAHRWGVLSEGAHKKINVMSYAVFEEDFEPMKRRIEAQGVKLFDAPRGIESNGFFFHDPNGFTIEVKVAEKTTPDEKVGFGDLDASGPANQPNSWSRQAKPDMRPLRFAHMLAFVASVPETIDFYQRTLGLRL